MNTRRRFLKTAAIGLTTTAVAGCTSSTSDDDYSDGDSDDNESQDKVEILSHEMEVDQDEYTSQVYVSGQLENLTDELLNYVEVKVRVYDSNGSQLDSYIDNVNDLAGGTTWSFEVMVLEEPDEIDSYDIAAEATQY